MAAHRVQVPPRVSEQGVKATSEKQPIDGQPVLSCGLVMPISSLDGCSPEHWGEVKSIITEAVRAITEPRFDVRLVSDADDIGIIQKRIVQNIYNSDIVVCDVSGKNPNVMFELGMRLAFDKPVVIVKDDKTDYTFDTGIIEHVTYPRDLRFQRIVDFKSVLAVKIVSTHNVAKATPDSSPFLKNFGKFQVASLAQTEVPADKLVLGMLEDLQTQVALLRRRLDVPDVLRDHRKHRSQDGITAILSAVVDHLGAETIAEPAKLIGNDAFYNEMAKRIGPGKYYGSAADFTAAVDAVLRSLTKDESKL